MSRIGQCPSCRTMYELDDDDIGQVFECECGITLFAADIVGFNEIPAFCSQCDGEYVVDRSGAGEQVECECGALITVPTIVLRQPVSTSDDLSETPSAQATSEPKLQQGERLVKCPDCSETYVVTKADLGVESQCSCGCVFAAKLGPNKNVVTEKVKQPKPTAPNQAAQRKSKPKASQDDTDGEDRAPIDRSKKGSPIKLISLLVVAPLLVLSLGFFIAQKSGLLTAAKNATGSDKPKPSVPRPIPEDLTVGPVSGETNSIQLSDKNVTEAEDDAGEAGAPNREMSFSGDPPVNDATPRPIPATTRQTDRMAGSPKEAKPTKPNRFAPPPKQPLPEAKQARERVPIPKPKNSRFTFARSFAVAFAEYEKTKELEASAKESGETKEYHAQLGKTIGLLQQSLATGAREGKADEIQQVRYLLTYLYYRAGWLAEASIMAESVARWGDIKESSTKEAAFIGLAATQEANQTHWGAAEEVGELDQMRAITELFAERWPDDPQLDLIRLSLAQTYERFGKPIRAAEIYDLIPKSSNQFITSQLAAGSALWAQYRVLAAESETPNEAELALQNTVRDRARKYLATGINKSIKDDPSPNKKVLTAKMALARLELSAGDLNAAAKWLTKKPVALTESISIDGEEDAIKFSAGFVRLVFETLFSIRSQQKDQDGAKAALSQLSAKLGDEHAGEIGKLFLSAATDYINQLSASPQINRDQFSTLAELIEPLKGKDATLTPANIMWLGESWSKLAGRASTPELAQQCNAKAAAAYEMAMAKSDFPSGSRAAGLLRRSQLLREAGQLSEAAELIGEVLKKTPNAFGLQIEAAQTLQKTAETNGKPLDLIQAVDGPPESAVWGWNKLVTVLYRSVSSNDPNDKNVQRLMMSQYQLANCKLQIVKATRDPARKAARTAELKKLVTRLSTNMKKDVEPWFGEFQKVKSAVEAL